MDLPSSVCSGVPLVVVADPLRWGPTMGLGAGERTPGEEPEVKRWACMGEEGLPELSMIGVPLSRMMAELTFEGTAGEMAGVRGCGMGSLLEPGGLGAGGKGLPFGVLRVALVVLGPPVLLDAVVGMGAPVEVVLSFMIR